MKKILLKSLSFFLITGTLCAADLGQDDDDEIVTSESESDQGGDDYQKSNFPLHIAIINREEIDVIQRIIHARPQDINKYYNFDDDVINHTIEGFDCDGLTPALLAAEVGYFETLRALHAAGADLNLQQNHEEHTLTPLVHLLQRACIEVVHSFLDLRDAQGNFVIDRRKEYKHNGIIETPFWFILEKLNDYFSTPDQKRSRLPDGNPDKYMPACLERDENNNFCIRRGSYGRAPDWFQLLQRFVKEDPSIINTVDSTGKTPLFKAIENKFNPYLISVLCSLGADPNIPDSNGVTPLIAAIKKTNRNQGFEPHQHSFDVLLASQQIPVDVNMADAQGLTPLWYAYDADWAYGFASLLRKGAAFDRDAYSQYLGLRSPFLISFLEAIENNDPSFDFSTQDVWGDTALMYLLHAKNNYFTEYLLQNSSTFRASVSSANLRGQTPLMIAAQQGSLDMLTKLVADYGANIDQKDKEGKTVFDYMDEYSVAQGLALAQMPDDDPKKRHQRQKVKDFLAFKYYLPQLFEQAKEKEIFNDFEQAFNVADRVDARINTQLLSAKERALDLADEIDRGLQLAKRPHLSDQ